MTAARGGRPIRFFLVLLGGWVAARSVFVTGWPIPESGKADVPATIMSALADPVRPVSAARAIAIASAAVASPKAAKLQIIAWKPYRPPLLTALQEGPTPAVNTGMPIDLLDFIRVTTAYANRHYASEGDMAPASALSPMLAAPPAFTPSGKRDRWTASAWLFWRDGSGLPDPATQGRLGGSQIGARIDFDLTPDARSRTTGYARASAALNRPAAPEAALGVAFQPSRAVPVSLMAERRVALGTGGRNAIALLAVGGFGPKAISPSLEAEGYGQAGMVGLRARDLFADGKISLLHSPATSRLRIGASVSGGAQPAVSRLDIGPEMQMRLPLSAGNARLALEWRERVAGNAAPRSGLALTLAADF